jgi:hypothetical protein
MLAGVAGRLFPTLIEPLRPRDDMRRLLDDRQSVATPVEPSTDSQFRSNRG